MDTDLVRLFLCLSLLVVVVVVVLLVIDDNGLDGQFVIILSFSIF